MCLHLMHGCRWQERTDGLIRHLIHFSRRPALLKRRIEKASLPTTRPSAQFAVLFRYAHPVDIPFIMEQHGQIKKNISSIITPRHHTEHKVRFAAFTSITAAQVHECGAPKPPCEAERIADLQALGLHEVVLTQHEPEVRCRRGRAMHTPWMPRIRNPPPPIFPEVPRSPTPPSVSHPETILTWSVNGCRAPFPPHLRVVGTTYIQLRERVHGARPSDNWTEFQSICPLAPFATRTTGAAGTAIACTAIHRNQGCI